MISPPSSRFPDGRLSSRLIFAADFADVDEARRATLALQPHLGLVKIGLELFVGAGPSALSWAREAGLPIFLDLKLHDIPATVERAVDRAIALGARMLTVHAAGGKEMLLRAVRCAEAAGDTCTIVAVTVLTSLDDGDLADLGVDSDAGTQARRLARLAFDQGVRAFVCSPEEVATLRAELGPKATLITPGVRAAQAATRAPAAGASSSGGGGKDDQKRIATAREAILRGADYVVVGRPIRDAADPKAAAEQIDRTVRDALAEAEAIRT
ncbi:orotidine-5'-phosphate decarboxylase [Pendulispora albinea]|uniref:Orotidine 5'-phosphate decarboxylase n=1 Tax=Pendulispora albinea TaxID=2741071 RepID=A0ABZ2M9R8_9BACT